MAVWSGVSRKNLTRKKTQKTGQNQPGGDVPGLPSPGTSDAQRDSAPRRQAQLCRGPAGAVRAGKGCRRGRTATVITDRSLIKGGSLSCN